MHFAKFAWIDRYLAALAVEPLDGDRGAVGVPAGEAEGAPVDAPEAALADHEQRAEVGRGAAELPETELPQAVCAPLLIQLRDAPRRGSRGLARRRPRAAGGLGWARRSSAAG